MNEKNPFGIRIGVTVKALVRKINASFSQHEIDLTVSQMVILNLLNNDDGLCQHSLAEMLNKDKSAVLRQINCLEKKHFLIKIPDPEDKRRKKLVLTKPGLKVLRKALNVENELLETVLGDVGEQDLKTFYRVLEQIYKSIQEYSYC
ncbi:MAG TPA: MarR family winged helix-turn-helix transcriptional regulator [Balneolaceae bacterium]|nr:MarR family winged helix-turn-helix transcriptional regulator [Balneolaceae bacterium]